MMTEKISVILAEDHLIVREGLRRFLDSECGFNVIGEVGDGRSAVNMVADLHPCVVVMDIALPLLNGIAACRHLQKAHSATRVLMLSAHSEESYVEAAIDAGAAGFVLKQASGQALSHAIREVHAGRPFYSEAILRRYRDTQSGFPGKTPEMTHPRLTQRELEVLQLVAEGKANKQTAAELGISLKTVEKHRTNLMNKLNIHDTATLTRYAIHAGII